MTINPTVREFIRGPAAGWETHCNGTHAWAFERRDGRGAVAHRGDAERLAGEAAVVGDAKAGGRVAPGSAGGAAGGGGECCV